MSDTWGKGIPRGSLVEIVRRPFGREAEGPHPRAVVLEAVGDNFYALALDDCKTGTSAYGNELRVLAYPTAEMEEKENAIELGCRLAVERMYRKEGFKLPVNDRLDMNRYLHRRGLVK